MDVVRITGEEINQQLVKENRQLHAENQALRDAMGAIKASHAELQRAYMELGRTFLLEEHPGAAYLAELRRMALQEHGYAAEVRRPA